MYILAKIVYRFININLRRKKHVFISIIISIVHSETLFSYIAYRIKNTIVMSNAKIHFPYRQDNDNNVSVQLKNKELVVNFVDFPTFLSK